MPTHNDDQSDEFLSSHGPKEIDASQGFEQTDVGVGGIVIFLVSLFVLVGVIGGVCYVFGKVINAGMDRQDGPTNKWAHSEDASIRQLGNLPNNPELQSKVSELTQAFPTPRLQNDQGDGAVDLAQLHVREDLLLENYTWVDQPGGKVRIPIERAMELIAQRGLPVAPAAQRAPEMTADAEPKATAPLTDGFARTGYEQEQARIRAIEAEKQ
jgi:hypothetical protein